MTSILSNTAAGNWNVAASWSPAQVPGQNDDVNIQPGHNITLIQNEHCLSIENDGTLTGGGFKLTSHGYGEWAGFYHFGTISGTLDLDMLADVGAFPFDIELGIDGAGAVRNLTINTGIRTVDDWATTSLTGTLTITSGTLDLQTFSLTHAGTASITGTLTGSTGTLVSNGAITTNGVLGSNTAWTFDQNADLTVASGGTFNAPNASGTWSCNGSVVINAGATMNDNGGTCTVDAAAEIGLSSGTGEAVYNNIIMAQPGAAFVNIVSSSGGANIKGTLTGGAAKNYRLFTATG